jgi:hypothetical protein
MQFFAFMAISTIAWLLLVFVVWKKKTNIFYDHMESKLAERRLKMLKAFLLVSGISLAAYIGFILHIVIFRSPDYEGGFFVAFFSIILFLIGLIGSLVILLRGRRKTT